MSQYIFTAGKAAADLSGKQHHVVRLADSDSVNQASEAVNTATIGVLTNKPKTNHHCAVQNGGVAYVVAGAAITAPALIATNGSGRAATAGSGDVVIGRALEDAGADGDVIRALLQPPVRWMGGV